MADPRDVLKQYGVLPGQPPVEQAGGGDPRLELELQPIPTPETSVDADYAEAKAAARAQDTLREEQAMAAEAAGPTPQSTLFPAPEKPSAIKAGADVGGRAAGEGVRGIVDGLRALVGAGPSTATAQALNLPAPPADQPVPDTMQAIKKVLIDGLMQLGLSPVSAAAGAAGQALENLAPEVAGATVADGFAAAGLRSLLTGTNPHNLPPAERSAMLEPLTVRDVIEMAGPIAFFGRKKAGEGVRAAGLAVEIAKPTLKGQRGALGFAASGKQPAEITRKDLVDIKRAAFPRGAFKGFLIDALGEHVGNVYLHEGKGYVAQVAEGGRGEIVKMLPGSFEPKAFQKVGSVPGGAGHEPVTTWKFKAVEGAADISGGSIGPEPPAGGMPREGAAPGGGAAPPGPEAPPIVGESRLNVERINAPDDVKRLMTDINKLQSERLAASRTTQTHAETIAAGEALHLTVEQALALDPLTVPLAEAKAHQNAFRDLNTAVSTHLKDLTTRVRKGEQGLDAEGWATFDLAGELSAKQEMLGTEAGRLLEARKIGAEAARWGFDPAEFMRLHDQMAGADRGPFDTVARRLEALPGGVNGARARSWMRQTWEMAKLGKDMVHELWINWLLTSPQTHVANIAGTALTTFAEIPERAFAEGIHRLFSDDPAGVQRGETALMIRSAVRGLSDGFRLAGKAAQHAADLSPLERQLLGQMAVEHPRTISSAVVAERVGWSMDNTWGKGVDVLGTIANLPTTGLGMEDALFKGLNYRLELSALALREARARGLEGAKLEAEIRKLEIAPTKDMMIEATDAAMVRTLNKELGPAGQSFMKFANTIPGGRVVAPFIRTPTNSFKWVGQRMPIMAQLSAKNWSDIQAGGARMEMAIARQALGAAFAAVVAYEVSQGNITGGGPTDQWLRKMQRDPATTTRPPYSVNGGGEWVSLNRIDPVFGTFVGAIADYVELSGKIPEQDDWDEYAAYGEALAIATGHLLINKTWMQSAKALLDAVSDPDRNFGKVGQSYARSLVPTGLRQITRATDDQLLREVKSIPDAIKSGLPYLVSQVPVARNPITGDAIEYPPGWGPTMLSPVLIYPKNEDPVFRELQANRIRLSDVPRAIGGTAREGPLLQEDKPGPAVKLRPEQRDYWILAMTQHVKLGGKNLHESLTELVTSDRYLRQSKGPGGGRELLFKSTYQAFKEKGFAMLWEASPSLQAAFKQQQRERAQGLLPVTDPRSPQHAQSPLNLLNTLGR